MKKLFTAPLVLALGGLVWAAPQTPAAKDQEQTQPAGQQQGKARHGKRSHGKRQHSNKQSTGQK